VCKFPYYYYYYLKYGILLNNKFNSVQLVFFSQEFVQMTSEWKTGAELSASWTVEVGDLDEAGD